MKKYFSVIIFLVLIIGMIYSDGLIDAIMNDKIEDVKKLVEKGEDINKPDNTNLMTPLHWAIYYSRFDMVKYLLEKGVSLNSKGNYGNGCLHYAAGTGNVDIVNLLLEKKVDINDTNDFGYTPLHITGASGFSVGKESDIKKAWMTKNYMGRYLE